MLLRLYLDRKSIGRASMKSTSLGRILRTMKHFLKQLIMNNNYLIIINDGDIER